MAKSATDKPNAKIDDVAECFLEIKELNSSIARLNQKKGATYSRYKNMGVDTDAVRECIKLEQQEDAAEWIKRVAQTAAILRIVPTETESDGQVSFSPVFSTEGVTPAMASRLALMQAFWEGHDAGLSGGAEADNKFEPGTESFVNWVKGYRDGWEERSARKPGSENVTKAPTEVRKKTSREQRVADRAATKPPETALERDEAAYRAPVDA